MDVGGGTWMDDYAEGEMIIGISEEIMASRRGQLVLLVVKCTMCGFVA